MPNVNRQTIYQMGNVVNDIVKQATGRESVQAIEMAHVSVEQNTLLGIEEFAGSVAEFITKKATDVHSLIIDINPEQAGTGDPSAENIREISGWTGVNIYDDSMYDKVIRWNQLAILEASGWRELRASITFDGTSISFTNISDYSVKYIEIVVPKNHKFLTFLSLPADTKNSLFGLYIPESSNDYSDRITIAAGNTYEKFFTTTDVYYALRFAHATATLTGHQTIIDNYQIYDLTEMFGAGNEPATVAEFKALFPNEYYEYNAGETTLVGAVNNAPNWTETISWETEAGTVYGGTLDVINGILTVTDAVIASYDGEELPSTWISDRDVYAEGTTPTTGAQVVYKLAEPITYELTPQEITTLAGQNNVWADTGDVSLSYYVYHDLL